MKKLLLLVSIVFCALAMSAQPGNIVKGKTFGTYTANGIIIPDIDRKTKEIDVQRLMTGMVAGKCTSDCCNRRRTTCTIYVAVEGKIITVGTGDFGFTVPNEIVGHQITIQGGDNTAANIRRRRPLNSKYQKEVEFVATGIKIIE